MNLRRALRWLGAVAGLAVACVALHFYGRHRLAQARADLARATTAPAPPAACTLPESDPRNAAFWFLSAGSLRITGRENLDLSSPPPFTLTDNPHPLVNRSPTTWSAGDLAYAAAELTGLKRTLELAYEADSRPVCEFRMPLSDPPDMRQIALIRPLLLETGFQLRQHRPEKAVHAVSVLGELASGLERQQNSLSQATGARIESSYLRGLHWILGAPDVPPGLLQSLRAGLHGESAAAALARYFATEAAFFVDDERMVQDRDGGVLGSCYQDLKQARSIEGFAAMRRWAELPCRQAERDQRAFSERFDNLARYGWTGAGVTKAESIIMSSYAGRWVELIEKLRGAAASRQLAALSLDLRIAAETRGAYPERLTAADAPGPDPLAGARPSYTRDAGGGVVLANARAAAAYGELAVSDRFLPFEWTLPAPAAAPR